MKKIQGTAAFLIPVLLVFALLYVVFTAGSTLSFALLDSDKWFESPWVDPSAPAPVWQRSVYAVVWLLPVIFGLFAVYAALRAVILIRAGILFDNRVSLRLRQAGLGTSGSGLTDFLATLMSPPLLSWTNPDGPAPIRWYFDSEPAGLIVCGGGFYLIGWIMAEAQRLADENEGFV